MWARARSWRQRAMRLVRRSHRLDAAPGHRNYRSPFRNGDDLRAREGSRPGIVKSRVGDRELTRTARMHGKRGIAVRADDRSVAMYTPRSRWHVRVAVRCRKLATRPRFKAGGSRDITGINIKNLARIVASPDVAESHPSQTVISNLVHDAGAIGHEGFPRLGMRYHLELRRCVGRHIKIADYCRYTVPGRVAAAGHAGLAVAAV